jgi:hypothetical protein
MSNDSSTGGYLSPEQPWALDDDALARALQAVVVGITGLDGTLVRPRWQPVVPRQPDVGMTWCAIGVTEEDPDDNPAVVHDGAADGGEGADTLYRHSVLNVLASFYGPSASAVAGVLRDGLHIPQNREAMTAQGLAFISSDKILAAPELVNQQWIRRYDLPLRLRRVVTRVYPVRNLTSAETQIQT